MKIYKLILIVLILLIFFGYSHSQMKMITKDIVPSKKYVDTTTNPNLLLLNKSVESYSFSYLIRIFPSPIVSLTRIMIFGISNAEGKPIKLKIYDLNGNFVEDISYAAKGMNDGKKADFTVDLGFLPRGIYFIEMEANNKRTAQKFIKE